MRRLRPRRPAPLEQLRPSRVASLSGNIDETSSASGINLDTAVAFGFKEEQQQTTSDQRNPQQQNNPFVNGLVQAPSQNFASMLEASSENEGFTLAKESGRVRKFANIVARAIKTYETNALVISGTQPQNGRELSMTL